MIRLPKRAPYRVEFSDEARSALSGLSERAWAEVRYDLCRIASAPEETSGDSATQTLESGGCWIDYQRRSSGRVLHVLAIRRAASHDRSAA